MPLAKAGRRRRRRRKERRRGCGEEGERFVELRRTFHFDCDCDCDARFVARVKSVAQTIDKLIDKLTKLPRDKGEREKRERKRGTEESGERGEAAQWGLAAASCRAINCSLKCCNANWATLDAAASGKWQVATGCSPALRVAGLVRHVACHKIINTLIELLTDTHSEPGERKRGREGEEESLTCECGAPNGAQGSGRGRGSSAARLVDGECVCFHASLGCRHAMASNSNSNWELGTGNRKRASHVSAIFKSLHCKMAASGSSNNTASVCVWICVAMCVCVCVCLVINEIATHLNFN